jgi:hypothetical protein
MLYEAAILVCLSVSPDTCHELKDTRGPYETKEACKVRVDEMSRVCNQSSPIRTRYQVEMCVGFGTKR